MDRRIRMTSTDSVNSTNKKTLLDVEMKRHAKQFPFPSVSYTIDQMEQFEKERAESTKYRLILNINPYCTNILFNAVTEIVQNEGTDEPNELRIASNVGINDIEVGGYTIKGKTTNVTNIDMVRNTEYTNGDKPFVYHCGYDIFNNHVLRNQTFKLVNPLPDNSNDRDVYNTIMDYMRYSDGSPVKYAKRTDVNTIMVSEPNKPLYRHLYLKDDVLEFMDSINTNLNEQDGWWGFYNRSTIPSCEYDVENKGWKDLNISKLFNNEQMGCGFIEMYPDSTLYSFNPKYNKFQNREEHNWDICITYPYENDYEKSLVCGYFDNGQGSIGDSFNGLLLASYTQINGTSGQPVILFRSFVKHNLNIGDEIKLFYSKNDSEDGIPLFYEIEDKLFKVTNTGDLKEENQNYYFYINDVEDILEELGDMDEIGENYTFRFVKVINNRDCKYYYRKFKKLPNYKFKREELLQEVVNNRQYINDEVNSRYNSEIQSFEEYIANNCSEKYVNISNKNEIISKNEYNNKTIDEKKNYKPIMLSFSKEQYPLGFSQTIYNDDKTQVVFTDTLDIDKLVDNLGRPLTELFVTIIKRNKGHNIWYKKTKTADELKNIEFSHCFGELISGIQVHDEWTDDNVSNSLLDLRLSVGDVSLLNNANKSFSENDDENVDNNENVNKIINNSLDNDITIEKNEFYGDVVELDCYNMLETTLSDVYFRFNTEQREHIFDKNTELNCGTFVYDEIVTDDYDYKSGFGGNKDDAFEVATYDMDCINSKVDDNNYCKYSPGTTYPTHTTYRPEGYFYKAHYPFLVREYGAVKQGSHKEIIISSCRPRQANGMFIEVVTALRYGISSGDVIYLCDDLQDETYPLFVNDVLSNVRFLVSPLIPSENNPSLFEIIEGLLHSDAHTITEDDIEYGYTWEDEDGLTHIASGEITDENDGEISPSDEGREVYDYSKPKYVLRIKNEEIPFYAYKVDSNLYMWRDLLTVGDKDVTNLEEYPFANGHFYINKDINFFLKRQDPFGDNGIYSEELIPNDVAGNVKNVNNYEYKDETHRIC